MKILLHCLKETNWPAVRERMLALYPDQKSNLTGYKQVWDQLLLLEPELTGKQVGIETVNLLGEVVKESLDSIAQQEKNSEEQIYVETFMIPAGDEPNYTMAALPWPVIVGLGISDKIMGNYSITDIVCHCLYELTFYGFTEMAVNNYSFEGDCRYKYKVSKIRHFWLDSYFSKERQKVKRQ